MLVCRGKSLGRLARPPSAICGLLRLPRPSVAISAARNGATAGWWPSQLCRGRDRGAWGGSTSAGSLSISAPAPGVSHATPWTARLRAPDSAWRGRCGRGGGEHCQLPSWPPAGLLVQPHCLPGKGGPSGSRGRDASPRCCSGAPCPLVRSENARRRKMADAADRAGPSANRGG